VIDLFIILGKEVTAMLSLRRSKERGHANYGWLDTYYTFSFNTYYDPKFMGFRNLRVINEDFIQPAKGFPTHGHSDMEIITYVISGDLSHRDSMGNGTTIRPHEVQRMSAGTGVLHSEFSSPTDETHLLQIWIEPAIKGVSPSYEQIYFPPSEKQGRLRLVASEDGRDGSVKLNQDVDLHAAMMENGDKLQHAMRSGRHAWIQVVKGEVSINGLDMSQGDGAAITEETMLNISSSTESEILLFDLN